MNSSNSFDSPMRSHESCGEFARPKFSPMYTSSPQNRNDSFDFIPFGSNSPGPHIRGKGRWKGHNRSFLSNLSSDSGPNSSFSSRSSPYRPNNHGHWRGRGNKGHTRNEGNRNAFPYYHPSMLEDPWDNLIKKLENSDSHCSSATKTKPESDDNGSENEVSIETEQSEVEVSQESAS